MFRHQLHKTGFPAAPDAGHNFDHFRILKRDHSLQIKTAFTQIVFPHKLLHFL